MTQKYRAPARVHAGNLLTVALLLAGAYASWKFVPPYMRAFKVDRVLTDTAYQSMEVKDITNTELRFKEARRLAGLARTQIHELGVTDEKMSVYFSPDVRFVHADYSEVVHHPVVNKDTVLRFERRVKIPGDLR